jgi:hypothetical protein
MTSVVYVINASQSFKYTTNGTVWETGTNRLIGTPSSGVSVAYGTDNTGTPRWVACAYNNSGNSIQYSNNGIDWLPTNASYSQWVSSVAFGYDDTDAPLWVALGYNPTNGKNIQFSYNGVEWQNALADPTNAGDSPIAIAYHDGLWLASGFVVSGPPTTPLYRSTNGKN